MKEQNYDNYKDRLEDEYVRGYEEEMKSARRGLIFGFFYILFLIAGIIILVSL